ncbi:hypothetical protein B0H10DRAFT_1946915 [Mycena sp. CBHHK59/15]|nr:hypothetical protein B0H10DRAFT_1946915 [Mycena sp. CBHHK59/15]
MPYPSLLPSGPFLCCHLPVPPGEVQPAGVLASEPCFVMLVIRDLWDDWETGTHGGKDYWNSLNPWTKLLDNTPPLLIVTVIYNHTFFCGIVTMPAAGFVYGKGLVDTWKESLNIQIQSSVDAEEEKVGPLRDRGGVQVVPVEPLSRRMTSPSQWSRERL